MCLFAVAVLVAAAVRAAPSSAPASTADDARAYDIHLDHPAWVGQRSHLELTGVRNTRFEPFSGERALGRSERMYGAKIVADAEVVAVREELPREIRYRVQALVTYDGRSDRKLLGPGTTVTVRAGNPTPRFRVDGKAPAPEVFAAMQFLIHLSDRDSPGYYDRCFGPGEPRRIGEQWPVNAREVASRMADYGTPLAPLDVRGNCTLAGKADVDGEPCLSITVDLHFEPFKLPTTGPAARADGNYLFDTNELDAHYVYDTPIDPRHSIRRATTSSVKRYTGRFAHSKRTFLETFREEWESQVTPLNEDEAPASPATVPTTATASQ
jgi:hypothetical protein